MFRNKRERQLNKVIKKAEKEAGKSTTPQVVYMDSTPGQEFKSCGYDPEDPPYLYENVIGIARVFQSDNGFVGQYESRLHKKPITKEMIKEAMDNGMIMEDAKCGYGIFSSRLMGNADHVKALECMKVFASDTDAALQARIDGFNIINDLPDAIDEEEREAAYIDTAENRKVISGYLKERYGILWH